MIFEINHIGKKDCNKRIFLLLHFFFCIRVECRELSE